MINLENPPIQIKKFFVVFLFLLLFLMQPESVFGGYSSGSQCEHACHTIYNANTLGCRPTVYVKDCYCRGVESPPRHCEECGSWQIATRHPAVNTCLQAYQATLWGVQKSECKCCADCIEAPRNPRYYDNPLYPLNPFEPEKSKDKDNIYLPVKLDWDDVEGWFEGGWRSPRPECVKRCNGERCIYGYPEKCQDWVDCRKNCKEKCLKEAEKFNWDIGKPTTAGERAKKEVEKEIEFRNFIPKCIRGCEINVCDAKIQPNPGCGAICSPSERCYPTAEYIKSYIIEIKGKYEAKMRDPEALREIEILEREIELIQTLFPDTPDAPRKIIENEEKINEIKQGELEVTFFGAALDKSEFIPPAGGFFKSNRTYQWRVRACCRKYKSYEEYKKAGEATCGKWSEWWEFKTNPAPEPRLPYDVDWAGEKESKNIAKWAVRFLRWAEIDDKEFEDEEKEEGKRCREWVYNENPEKTDKKTGSYLETLIIEGEKSAAKSKEYCRENYCLTIHSRKENKEKPLPQLYCRPLTHNAIFTYRYQETDKDKCHPQLELEEKCQPKIIYPFPSGWPAAEPSFPLPQFLNEKYLYFTKLTSYSWQVDACIEVAGEKCTDWSQKWRFFVADFVLEKPKVVTPPDDPETPVGLPVLLSWSEIEGARTYRYEISNIGRGIAHASEKAFDHPQLKLDTVYRWRVDPCWDYEGKKCENNWSDTFSFRTTGRPPRPETMRPLISLVPVTFRWEAVPGAKSYRFILHPSAGPGVVGTIEEIVEEPTVTLDYPELVLNSNYTWQVETCARDGGGLCGRRSDYKPLSTSFLPPPSNLRPENEEKFVVREANYYLSWDKVEGANFYKYRVEYIERAPEETDEKCQLGIITPGGESGAFTIHLSNFVPLKCLGKYRWQVKSCLGGLCDTLKEGSIWSLPLTFSLIPAPPPPAGPRSLIPCGRRSNDPNTPWDETDPCEIKHIFILLRNIFTFLIQIILPLSLVVLLIATGIFFYLSKESLETIATIKRMWRAAGIGFGLIIFAWLIVDFILLIMGYPVGVFRWWEIRF